MMKEKKIRNVKTEIRGVDEDKGIVSARVSTDVIDRYEEKIVPSAFKKNIDSYKAHPVLLSSHQYPGLTNNIGRAIPESIVITDKYMDMDFEYFIGEGNKEADWGFFLAKKGIAAYSIGFIGHKWQDGNIKDDGYWAKLVEGELLENSQVTVPANPEGLQKMYKRGLMEESEFKQLDDLLNEFIAECKEFGIEYDKDPEPKVRTIDKKEKVDYNKLYVEVDDIKISLADHTKAIKEVVELVNGMVKDKSKKIKSIYEGIFKTSQETVSGSKEVILFDTKDTDDLNKLSKEVGGKTNGS